MGFCIVLIFMSTMTYVMIHSVIKTSEQERGAIANVFYPLALRWHFPKSSEKITCTDKQNLTIRPGQWPALKLLIVEKGCIVNAPGLTVDIVHIHGHFLMTNGKVNAVLFLHEGQLSLQNSKVNKIIVHDGAAAINEVKTVDVDILGGQVIFEQGSVKSLRVKDAQRSRLTLRVTLRQSLLNDAIIHRGRVEFVKTREIKRVQMQAGFLKTFDTTINDISLTTGASVVMQGGAFKRLTLKSNSAFRSFKTQLVNINEMVSIDARERSLVYMNQFKFVGTPSLSSDVDSLLGFEQGALPLGGQKTVLGAVVLKDVQLIGDGVVHEKAIQHLTSDQQMLDVMDGLRSKK